MQLRDTLGTIYTDEQFADLFPTHGQPVEAPWLCWLLAVSVCQMRPLRTPNDISRALPIPQSTCKIDSIHLLISQRGNVHCV
jgi:hypothetical protein